MSLQEALIFALVFGAMSVGVVSIALNILFPKTTALERIKARENAKKEKEEKKRALIESSRYKGRKHLPLTLREEIQILFGF